MRLEGVDKKCHKQPFGSRKEAKAQTKLLNKIVRDANYNGVYYCIECSCWHVTSLNKRQQRKLKIQNPTYLKKS